MVDAAKGAPVRKYQDTIRPECVNLQGALLNILEAAHDLSLYGGKDFSEVVLRVVAKHPEIYALAGGIDPRAVKVLELLAQLAELARDTSPTEEEGRDDDMVRAVQARLHSSGFSIGYPTIASWGVRKRTGIERWLEAFDEDPLSHAVMMAYPDCLRGHEEERSDG